MIAEQLIARQCIDKASLSTRRLRSRFAVKVSAKPGSDREFLIENPMFSIGNNPASLAGNPSLGKGAFGPGTITRYVPAAKCCAIFLLALLALPRKKDPSKPDAFLWIFPGNIWVWPLWLATMIAFAAILLIGGRDYDSFFASRYSYDRASSAWIRLRTSTDPSREHQHHALMTVIFFLATCFLSVEIVFFFIFFFAKLLVLDSAIKEGNLQERLKPLWLAHPGVQTVLAALPVFFCRMLIQKNMDIHFIGVEARYDRLENERSRRRHNEIRLRMPFLAQAAEPSSSSTITPTNTSVSPSSIYSGTAPRNFKVTKRQRRSKKPLNRLIDKKHKFGDMTSHMKDAEEASGGF